MTGYKTAVSKLSVQEKSEILRKMPMGGSLVFSRSHWVVYGDAKNRAGNGIASYVTYVLGYASVEKISKKTDVCLYVVAKTAITPLCGLGSSKDGPYRQLLGKIGFYSCFAQMIQR